MNEFKCKTHGKCESFYLPEWMITICALCLPMGRYSAVLDEAIAKARERKKGLRRVDKPDRSGGDV
jgi:hypothetical protein